jgi:hypothetical protein
MHWGIASQLPFASDFAQGRLRLSRWGRLCLGNVVDLLLENDSVDDLLDRDLLFFRESFRLSEKFVELKIFDCLNAFFREVFQEKIIGAYLEEPGEADNILQRRPVLAVFPVGNLTFVDPDRFADVVLRKITLFPKVE